MKTGEMLDLLAKMGAPRVSRMEDGTWNAAIKFPAPDGVTAEVRSDFHHPTHESALIQLIARVEDMRGIGDNISKAMTPIGGKVVNMR